MRFTKMQGAGNDYVYVNGFVEDVQDPGVLAEAISDRHFGVGSDGLILILPSDKADFRMRMFNADGSEGAMCGNGARCVGRFVYEKGLTDKTAFTLETGGGVREIRLNMLLGKIDSVTVDMGEPVGYAAAPEGARLSMGSDHLVIGVQEDPFAWADGDFVEMGAPLCEKYDANIEFVQVRARGLLRMRVYERGSGETLACGSGACATAVSMHREGYADSTARVQMRGGEVKVAIREEDGHVLMTGPAVTVFEGDWPS